MTNLTDAAPTPSNAPDSLAKQGNQPEFVTVCMCTMDRASLHDTLKSIAEQELPVGIALKIVVADNSETPARQVEVETAFETNGLNGLYVHAPVKNISIARNACLDNATTRWAIFIDDDEIAQPGWIARLLAGRKGKDCIFGIALAVYDEARDPKWMREADFHSNRIGPRDGIQNGYTCNTLLNMDFVRTHELRFDPKLGTVGGEDTMFFHQMAALGAKFDLAEDAIVSEDVAESRANLGWLMRRRFRAGQIHFLLLKADGKKALPAAVLAAAKAVFSWLSAIVTLYKPSLAAENYLRGALHCGVVYSAFGGKLYEEYA